MHVAFGRVRRKSRIGADYTDDADYRKEERNRKYRLLQFIQNLMSEAEADADPTDDGDIDNESMTVATFGDVLKSLNPIIGLILATQNRPEKALPLLKEGFETARKEGDAELIVSFG